MPGIEILQYRFNSYSVILLITTLVALFIVRTLWRRRSSKSAFLLALFQLAVAAWAFPIIFEAAAQTRQLKLIWSIIAYPGTTGSPLLFFLFALAYTQHEGLLRPRSIALMTVIPLMTNLLAATNPWHGWVWRDIVLQPEGYFAIYYHGPWFWVFVSYSYALILAGSLLIMLAAIRYPSFYQAQNWALLLACLFPIIGSVVYVFDLNPIPGLDWTPVALLLSGLVLAMVIQRFRLFDLRPRARNQVMDALTDGIIVLDNQERIVDINRAAAAWLGRPVSELIGKRAAVLLPFWKMLESDAVTGISDLLLEFQVELPGKGACCLDIARSIVADTRGNPDVELLILRDVTARKRLEEERTRLLHRLQKALDEVRTLSGLLPICAGCKKIRDDQGCWKSVEEYVSEHHSGVKFSHTICPECTRELYPELGRRR